MNEAAAERDCASPKRRGGYSRKTWVPLHPPCLVSLLLLLLYQ